jgi:hypothetical protein
MGGLLAQVQSQIVASYQRSQIWLAVQMLLVSC